MLQSGDRIPDFALASDRGQTVSAASLRGSRYVLFFYPKDETPTCTREVCSFRDHQADFAALGVPVFGVSADVLARHTRFVRKHRLNFPLLADTGRQLIDAAGLWVEKTLYGRKYFGIQRSTFVVGADGRIEKAWEKVAVDSHTGDVLTYLRGEAGAAQAAKGKMPARTPRANPGKTGTSARRPASAKRAGAQPAAAKKKVPPAKSSRTRPTAKRGASATKSVKKTSAVTRRPAATRSTRRSGR